VPDTATSDNTARQRPAGGRAGREVLAVAAGVVAYVALVWLLRGELGMVWDEPPDIERVDAIRDWLGQWLIQPFDVSSAFRPSALQRRWSFCGPAPHEHPPVYAWLSLASGESLGWLIGPLRAHRLSTVVLFAVAAGVLVRFVRQRWGTLAAAAAFGGLIFNPRLFADAQLVTLDAVLGAFWFFAAVAFLRGCETGRRPWLFGVLCGLAVMSKAPGVLVWPVLALWSALYRPKGALRQLAWALPIAPAVMVLVHPGWWTDPLAGPWRWAAALLDYQQKVCVYYLGRVFDPRTGPLPWHSTAVLTATMVPVGLLALAAIGVVSTGVRRLSKRRNTTSDVPRGDFLPDDAVVVWAALPFVTLAVLRFFSFMPVHDGLRQLAIAFFFFPVLVGYGARLIMRACGGAWCCLARGVVCVCIASAAWETLAIHPYELAYYNVLIGGPKGAKAAGMETTYYWDAATDEVLDWMNANLAPGTTVLIYPPPDVRTFGWLQRHGRLRRDLVFLDLDAMDRLRMLEGEAPCVVLFQMRQGLYKPGPQRISNLFDRLAEQPARYELAPRRVGVRLLAIFGREELAVVAAGRQ
jgi:hypothetical protein